jgi:hypothetical protein
MNKDYIIRIGDNDKVYKKCLNTRTYHKIIRGFDMFVYRHKNNNWVCIDSITGACIDNVIFGHKTKKVAFESAIQKYNIYTDDQIRKAHQNALEWLESGKG